MKPVYFVLGWGFFGWQVRESVRARIRNIIRQLLRRYKYPPDGQRAAIDLVIQQAEALSRSWTASTESAA